MDAALKAKWIEALRSGKYEQAYGTMAYGRGYCCLGVLCVVANEPFDPEDDMPRLASLADLGLEPYVANKLAAMNDGQGEYIDNSHTFPEIANWLERQP